jgi:hypothetical protein
LHSPDCEDPDERGEPMIIPTYRRPCDDQASLAIEDQDKYLDLKGLSCYSSLSIRTLRDYLSDPSDPIPAFCVRRKILVKKSDFDRWISRHRIDTKDVSRLVDDMVAAFSGAS